MSQGEKVPEEKKIPKASLSFADQARTARDEHYGGNVELKFGEAKPKSSAIRRLLSKIFGSKKRKNEKQNKTQSESAITETSKARTGFISVPTMKVSEPGTTERVLPKIVVTESGQLPLLKMKARIDVAQAFRSKDDIFEEEKSEIQLKLSEMDTLKVVKEDDLLSIPSLASDINE